MGSCVRCVGHVARTTAAWYIPSSHYLPSSLNGALVSLGAAVCTQVKHHFF